MALVCLKQFPALQEVPDTVAPVPVFEPAALILPAAAVGYPAGPAACTPALPAPAPEHDHSSLNSSYRCS